MKTRKLIVSCLVLLFTTSLLFPASMQKPYSVNSPEWKTAAALCMTAGMALPSSVSPVTGEEIAQAVMRIPDDRLLQEERALKEKLLDSLGWKPMFATKNFGADVNPTITPEFYVHSSKTDRSIDYLFPIKERNSLLNFSFDFDFASVGYGYVDYLALSPTYLQQYDKTWGTNADALADFQHDGTLNAGIIFGNDWMNFGIMRGRQSLGYGKTGNLQLSDNFSRQDFLRFHTFSAWFNYTLDITHYNLMKGTDDIASMEVEPFNANGKHQIMPTHRFEVTLFNRLQLVFNEGAIMELDNPLDWRLLNPFIFLHGMDNFAEQEAISGADQANNYLSMEIGYTVIPHLRLNFQAVIDQIQIPSEVSGYDPVTICPQAYGFLGNIETSWILKDSYLNAWLETAYTTPYLYLNKKKNSDNSRNHNFDMIVGYDNWRKADEIGYTGYPYGGDAVVLAIGSSYGKLGVFSVDGSLTYVLHGPYGWGYGSVIPPRGIDHLNDATPSSGLSNAEHRLEVKTTGSYTPTKGLTLNAGLGFVQIWNYRNAAGTTWNDIQFMVGVALDFVRMFH